MRPRSWILVAACLTTTLAAGAGPLVTRAADSSGTGPLIRIKNTLLPIENTYNQPGLLERGDTQQVLVGRVAAVVGIFLGLLGLIFIMLIIYGGYLWMTARGNEQQVEQAQQVIRQAVIGVIIILGAGLFTAFVVGEVFRATIN